MSAGGRADSAVAGGSRREGENGENTLPRESEWDEEPQSGWCSLCPLQREEEERWRVEKEALQSEVERASHQLRETSTALAAMRAEKDEVCAMLHPPPESGEVARRLVEVSAEKEDVHYQLSCCQGQLETQMRKAELAEV